MNTETTRRQRWESASTRGPPRRRLQALRKLTALTIPSGAAMEETSHIYGTPNTPAMSLVAISQDHSPDKSDNNIPSISSASHSNKTAKSTLIELTIKNWNSRSSVRVWTFIMGGVGLLILIVSLIFHTGAADKNRADPETATQLSAEPQSASVPATVEKGQEPSMAPGGFDDAESAKQRTAAYFSAWSSENDPNGSSIATFYADNVTFYGSHIGKAALMEKKAAFAKRWPVRLYSIEPTSIKAECITEHLCAVNGLVMWQASSPQENRHASGIADFVFQYSGGLIVSEAGKVISRDR